MFNVIEMLKVYSLQKSSAFYLNDRGYENPTSGLVLYFDLRPGPKCHSRWCTGRKWHIPMAVRRGSRVDGNWLTKWDKLKKIPWYSHRLTHRRRVTSELHDSYFRLMTIKHAISKIEWAIEWALLNYYITQSRQKSRQFEFQGYRVEGNELW